MHINICMHINVLNANNNIIMWIKMHNKKGSINLCTQRNLVIAITGWHGSASVSRCVNAKCQYL